MWSSAPPPHGSARTLYPLFVERWASERFPVGPPYFNIVIVPLMVPLFCSWP